MTVMPKPRPPYLETFLTRHGARLWYFRVGKGPRTPMPGAFGSPEFRLAYSKALAAHEAGKQPADHTLAWLVDQYLASPAWAGTAKETRKQFKYQFARMRERAAKAPLNELNAASIAAVRCAENGATEIELNAMFGWADGSNESATYVRNASRAKMGRRGSVKMIPQTKSQTKIKDAESQ